VAALTASPTLLFDLLVSQRSLTFIPAIGSIELGGSPSNSTVDFPFGFNPVRRAATALGVSQSSVSQRIKELEQHLGILLFERRHRGVTITPAGQHFLDEVRRGIENIDNAVKTAGMMSRGEQGILRIGFYSSLADGFLPTLLGRYQHRRPKVEIRLTEGTSQSNIALLRQNVLDIAFVIGEPVLEDCHSRPLWHERLLFALPKDHPLASNQPIAWKAVRDETFIISRAGKGPELHDHLVHRFSQNGLRAKVQRVEVGRDNLVQMVALGGGISLTCESTAAVPIEGVVYRPVAGDEENFLFSAVWSPFNRSAILREFLEAATKLEQTRISRLLRSDD
jgi:DNA-binding transcriptional LysR family regulator